MTDALHAESLFTVKHGKPDLGQETHDKIHSIFGFKTIFQIHFDFPDG